jgi:hypothetical protein
MDRERISRYSSVVVPTYFKVYESKKSLSSILKLYARRLARWFSCGTLIAECHSINNLQIWSENMASKQDTYSVLEAVCLLNALGARWPHWVNEKAEVDSSQKMCEAHVCWLSVLGCLPPVVCIQLFASGCLPPAVCSTVDCCCQLPVSVSPTADGVASHSMLSSVLPVPRQKTENRINKDGYNNYNYNISSLYIIHINKIEN